MQGDGSRPAALALPAHPGSTGQAPPKQEGLSWKERCVARWPGRRGWAGGTRKKELDQRGWKESSQRVLGQRRPRGRGAELRELGQRGSWGQEDVLSIREGRWGGRTQGWVWGEAKGMAVHLPGLQPLDMAPEQKGPEPSSHGHGLDRDTDKQWKSFLVETRGNFLKQTNPNMLKCPLPATSLLLSPLLPRLGLPRPKRASADQRHSRSRHLWAPSGGTCRGQGGLLSRLEGAPSPGGVDVWLRTPLSTALCRA